jgi:hypothetical protein
VIAAIQSKPDATSNTDSANANSGRGTTPLAFLSTLTAVANKFNDAHAETQTGTKSSHDRKGHEEKKTEDTSQIMEVPLAAAAVAVTVVVPVVTPIVADPMPTDATNLPALAPVELSKTDSSILLAELSSIPSSPTVAMPIQKILPSMPLPAMAQTPAGDTPDTPSAPTDGAAAMPTVRPHTSGTLNFSKSLPMDGVTVTRGDAGTQTLGGVTNKHEDALRKAVAIAMQGTDQQDTSSPLSATGNPCIAIGSPGIAKAISTVATGSPVIGTGIPAMTTGISAIDSPASVKEVAPPITTLLAPTVPAQIDAPTGNVKDSAALFTTDLPPVVSASASQVHAPTGTPAAPAIPTATALTGMPATKGYRGTLPARLTSPAGAIKTTGTQEATTATGHHKISATEDSTDASSSGTASDSDQSKSEASTQPLDTPSVQASFVPHVGNIEQPVAVIPNLAQAPTSGAATVPIAPGAVTVPSPAQLAPPDAISAPVVHSARLIQSIQQSDMRVGINSSEFGAISIHTSSSQGLVSSEITLGHAELAKAINAHLSAMQDKPGPVPALSVRVETSSSTGGSSAGFSQGSQDQKQQQRSEVSHPFNSRSTGSQPWMAETPPIAALSQGALSGRLDIRV